jgi:predicted ester cyclase
VTTNLVVPDGARRRQPDRARHAPSDLQGVPPTGRRWAATCSAFFRVEAERIADAWVNWDVLGILDQLGGGRRADTASV